MKSSSQISVAAQLLQMKAGTNKFEVVGSLKSDELEKVYKTMRVRGRVGNVIFRTDRRGQKVIF